MNIGRLLQAVLCISPLLSLTWVVYLNQRPSNDVPEENKRQEHLEIKRLQELLSTEREKASAAGKEGRPACTHRGEAQRDLKPAHLYIDNHVSALEGDPNDVPQLQYAWRRAKINYHDIRVTDRYRTQDGEADYGPLLDLLTMNNGIARYGPTLFGYEFCKVVKDKCLLYTRAECALRLECAWCSEALLCMHPNATSVTGKSLCPTPLTPHRISLCLATHNHTVSESDAVITHVWMEGQLSRIPSSIPLNSTCQQYVRGKPILVSFSKDASRAYYHWYNEFMMNFWSDLEGTKADNERLLIIMGNSRTMRLDHLSNLGLFSKECFRFRNEIPDGTCFYSAQTDPPADPPDLTFAPWLLNRLGLNPVPNITKPHVGIVSRKQRRFLLNEQELVQESLKQGLSTELLTLDAWPLYLQLKAIRRTTIMIGIHGSGFVNNLFLPEGAVSIQIMPFKTSGGSIFYQRFAEASGVVYKEWENNEQNDTVLHWEVLRPAEHHFVQEVLNSEKHAGGRLFYRFWVNQDSYISPTQFRKLLSQALGEGIHRHLLANA